MGIPNKKITIYLADGLSRGVRVANIDQWSGRVIASPRNQLKEALRLFAEIGGGCCVYFLTGNTFDEDLPNVYVGESDQIIKRVKEHERKKEWWDDVIIFFSPDGSLTTAGTKYLEHVCINRIKKSAQSTIKNSACPNERYVPLEDKGGLEIFYKNIALLLPLLGYDILAECEIEKGTNLRSLLFCKRKGIIAIGKLLEDGKMLVFKDSEAVLRPTPSFSKHPYNQLREHLMSAGKLREHSGKLIFSDNHVFNSPSAACAVILGNSANGKLEWKNEGGKSLREIVN